MSRNVGTNHQSTLRKIPEVEDLIYSTAEAWNHWKGGALPFLPLCA
jgi:hypothetical protein